LVYVDFSGIDRVSINFYIQQCLNGHFHLLHGKFSDLISSSAFTLLVGDRENVQPVKTVPIIPRYSFLEICRTCL